MTPEVDALLRDGFTLELSYSENAFYVGYHARFTRWVQPDGRVRRREQHANAIEDTAESAIDRAASKTHQWYGMPASPVDPTAESLLH